MGGVLKKAASRAFRRLGVRERTAVCRREGGTPSARLGAARLLACVMGTSNGDRC